jgi:hypothetical protein
VSKKDDKVRDNEYQPSENDDEMSEVVSSMNREIQSFKDMKVYEICPREES